MSRGLGNIQRSVLRRAHDLGRVSAARIRWDLAESLGQLHGEGITRSFDSSFRRAWTRLKENPPPGVTFDSAQLATLEDVVAVYPWQSPRSEIRKLREEYLPLLAQIASESGRRFGGVDTERNALGRFLSADTREPGLRLQATDEWNSIEHKLFVLLRNSKQHTASAVVDLIAKGRELFRGVFGSYRIEMTFKQCVQNLIHAARDCRGASETLHAIVAFSERWIRPDEILRSTLKATLYLVADFRGSQLPRLHAETKQRLFETYPDRIAQILGLAPDRVESIRRDLRAHHEPQLLMKRSILDEILSRDVLRKIEFVSVAQ